MVNRMQSIYLLAQQVRRFGCLVILIHSVRPRKMEVPEKASCAQYNYICEGEYIFCLDVART